MQIVFNYAPAFANDPKVVEAAVVQSPGAIVYTAHELQEDRRILKAAFANSCIELALSVPCLAKYNDDTELVRLAIEANGANISPCFRRIRNDYEMADIALKNQRDWYLWSVYPSLSRRLRNNREIALMEAQSESPALRWFPKKFLDDDEIALCLLQDDKKKHLLGDMSKRILEKYDL